MGRTVHVDLGDRSYDIVIGVSPQISAPPACPDGSKALVVSDSNVDPLYGDRCAAALETAGVQAFRVVIPAGEESKCAARLAFLYEKALDHGLDRSSIVVALGGGVVGDLAGFMASTFLRGIRLVQLPTSLLAMVDSSVGGKTAINLDQGKNLVGTFYQPVGVTIDLATLTTLPARQFAAGLAEVVKYGVIYDASLFELLENNVDKLLARQEDLMETVVARCCEIKAEVVAEDERESGVRAILNFGHTLGHALEKCGGYGQLLHGEALSVGMIYAARLSCAEKGMPRDDADRLVALLRALQLPPCLNAGSAAWKEVRRAMAVDKKTRSSVPRFVLAERIGSVIIGCPVPEDLLESAFVEVLCPE